MYIFQVSDERLQDHWFSGCLFFSTILTKCNGVLNDPKDLDHSNYSFSLELCIYSDAIKPCKSQK